MEIVYALRDIEHRLGEHFCLTVPRLDIDRHKIHVVSGLNGSGKSTLLRILALLLKPQRGSLSLSGQPVDLSPSGRLSLRRKITLVEQSSYLLHGSIFSNLTFGLKVRRISRAEQRQRIDEILPTVGLTAYSERSIEGLSAGEIQRVALARALVLNPEVLLLDEPTANIDHESIDGFERLLRDLATKGVTIVMSTHDPEQARRLNGALIRLQDGALQTELT